MILLFCPVSMRRRKSRNKEKIALSERDAGADFIAISPFLFSAKYIAVASWSAVFFKVILGMLQLYEVC
jgi:hypothetical protein